jgi:hypothetical protein
MQKAADRFRSGLPRGGQTRPGHRGGQPAAGGEWHGVACPRVTAVSSINAGTNACGRFARSCLCCTSYSSVNRPGTPQAARLSQAAQDRVRERGIPCRPAAERRHGVSPCVDGRSPQVRRLERRVLKRMRRDLQHEVMVATGRHRQLPDQRPVHGLVQISATAEPQVQAARPGQPEWSLPPHLPGRRTAVVGPRVEPYPDEGISSQGVDLTQQHQPPLLTGVTAMPPATRRFRRSSPTDSATPGNPAHHAHPRRTILSPASPNTPHAHGAGQ